MERLTYFDNSATSWSKPPQVVQAVAKLLGCPHPTQIIFTHNATEAINLALKGFLKPGQRVLTTAAEHNAVWRPLNVLARDRDVVLHTIPVSSEGVLDLEAAQKLLRDGIDLCVFVHGSNVIGSILSVTSAIPRAWTALLGCVWLRPAPIPSLSWRS